MRECIYVSAGKVERMAATTSTSLLRRVTEAHVDVGGVGAGVTLQELTPRSAVAAVEELERQVRKQFGVKPFADSRLSASQWIYTSATPMAYGVLDVRGMGDAAVAFLAELDFDFDRNYLSGVILLGSKANLLDRTHDPVDPGQSMSDPQAMTRLLNQYGLDLPPYWSYDDDEPEAGSLSGGSVAYAFSNIYNSLARDGVFPIEALARVVRIVEDPHARLVLASPLFVAHAPVRV